MTGPRLGVLALQGAFAEHVHMLRQLGAHAVEVRTLAELEGLDGVVLPGGESTTMGKLLVEEGMLEPLRSLCRQVPVLGTCAGMILLAQRLPQHEEQPRLALMDIAVQRNAFGRQKESFVASLDVQDFGSGVQAVFIRAPLVLETGSGVQVLARVGDQPVAVRQDNLLALSFHPELGSNTCFHAWLVREARAHAARRCRQMPA